VILLRRVLGDALRRHRQSQERTLREVSSAARISLTYLSEVERGRKEPSSELLSAICGALGVPLSDVLREASDVLATQEAPMAPVDVLAPASARGSVANNSPRAAAA
jgi:transcriptional regulator with XRE-family HTH domain